MAIAWMSLWLFFHHDEAFLGKIRSFSLYRWRIVFLILYLLLNGNFLALLHDLKIAPAYLKEQKGREVLVMQRKNEGIKDVLIPVLNNKPQLIYFKNRDIAYSFNGNWNHLNASYWGIDNVRALPQSFLQDEKRRRLDQGDVKELCELGETTQIGRASCRERV